MLILKLQNFLTASLLLYFVVYNTYQDIFVHICTWVYFHMYRLHILFLVTQLKAKGFLLSFVRKKNDYRIVASASQSGFEAHVGLFKLVMKRYFLPLCTVTFWQKVDFLISIRISTRDFTVFFIHTHWLVLTVV